MVDYRFCVCAAAIMLLAITTASSVGAPIHVSADQIRAWAISLPLPTYPESARLRRATGTGYFKLRVQRKTGRVKEVTILRTTGDKDLDSAAVSSLRQWRFKPGVLPSIRNVNPKAKDAFADEDYLAMVPVTFFLTIGGAPRSWLGSSSR